MGKIKLILSNEKDADQDKEWSGNGVTVRFLKEGLEFPPEGKANPMQTLQLQMLGAFAEFERSVIRERQREGIEIAKRKGCNCLRVIYLNMFESAHFE